MTRINLHKMFQYLEKENPTQLKGLVELRLNNPEAFEKRTAILHKELMLSKSSFAGCSLVTDGNFLKSISKSDEELYHFGGDFPKLFDWKQTKQLTRSVYTKHEKLSFFFGDSDCLKGKLVAEINPYKQDVPLLGAYRKDVNGMPQEVVMFLDDRIDRREWALSEQIKGSFWFYQFISNCREYLVLSEERLDLESGVVEGNLINIDDFASIGQNTKLKTQTPIIFLNKWHSLTGKLKSKKEFVKVLNKLKVDRTKYNNFLFQHPDGKTYNHPRHFQELVSAFLLSSGEGYPLHLLVVARQGSGKSVLEECTHHKFDEDVEIVEGSGSTIKTLIPSFKGNIPTAGALLSSNRICVIDEFLRILMRVKIEDRNEQLSSLNPILEHKRRKFGSGNGSISAQASCRLLMVSNPVYDTGTMETLCERIDNSFLSRLLVWYQDKEHIKFVQKGKGKQRNTYNIDKEQFLAIVDFMHSFKSEFNDKEVEKIFQQGLSLIGDDTEGSLVRMVRDVYTARYQYHIRKLLDGIIKTRCLCTINSDFKAIPEDYLLLAEIWLKMILGWKIIKEQFVEDEIRGKLGK